MPFDDGTPLDAAALQDLDRRIIEMQASIPRIGQSASVSQGNDLSNSTFSAKQIVGGYRESVELIPGQTTQFRIEFGGGIESDPTAIILTPTRGSSRYEMFSFAVDKSTLKSDGVFCYAYLSPSAKSTLKVGFFYILICH